MRFRLRPVLLAAFGCSILAAASHAQAPANAANPAVAALYAAAKKEGKVVLWGTSAREVDWVAKAFNAVYPGIEVSAMGDTSSSTKVIAEARSGRYSVDVISTSLRLASSLNERKLLKAMDWAPFDVPKGNLAYEGRFAYTHNTVSTIAYNKDKVRAADVPTRWEQLLDARYKGKVVGSPFLLPRLVGSLAMVWGEEKALKFARDLRANADVMLTNSPREVLLQSGERLYAAAEIDSFPQQWARDGMPVAFVIPEPVVMSQFGVLALDKAPHPAAAQLLAGWLASPGGKAAREKMTFEADYLPTSTNALAKKIHASREPVLLDTPELMDKRMELVRRISPVVSGQAK